MERERATVSSRCKPPKSRVPVFRSFVDSLTAKGGGRCCCWKPLFDDRSLQCLPVVSFIRKGGGGGSVGLCFPQTRACVCFLWWEAGTSLIERVKVMTSSGPEKGCRFYLFFPLRLRLLYRVVTHVHPPHVHRAECGGVLAFRFTIFCCYSLRLTAGRRLHCKSLAQPNQCRRFQVVRCRLPFVH